MPYQVESFTYIGFIVKSNGIVVTDYTAEFEGWTNDPGITVCLCSDGLERHIPTCCLIGYNAKSHSKQDLSKKILFGAPSNS